jgi:hypothetical protein
VCLPRVAQQRTREPVHEGDFAEQLLGR